jgi:hypothetical protein
MLVRLCRFRFFRMLSILDKCIAASVPPLLPTWVTVLRHLRTAGRVVACKRVKYALSAIYAIRHAPRHAPLASGPFSLKSGDLDATHRGNVVPGPFIGQLGAQRYGNMAKVLRRAKALGAAWCGRDRVRLAEETRRGARRRRLEAGPQTHQEANRIHTIGRSVIPQLF